MKLYLNNGAMIECTVDEFEELYARGYLGENGMQKALDKQAVASSRPLGRGQFTVTTVADLVERLQKMLQDLPGVDKGKMPFEDVFEDIKYYDDGREEKVVVVY